MIPSEVVKARNMTIKSGGKADFSVLKGDKAMKGIPINFDVLKGGTLNLSEGIYASAHDDDSDFTLHRKYDKKMIGHLKVHEGSKITNSVPRYSFKKVNLGEGSSFAVGK